VCSAAAPSAGSGLPDLILAKVRDIPDYPQPGIVFKDITPLLADGSALTAVVAALAGGLGEGGGADRGPGAGAWDKIDKVVGIEARGFILAAPVAGCVGAGFVAVR
jgi:adenine phosphoribosyltransferase